MKGRKEGERGEGKEGGKEGEREGRKERGSEGRNTAVLIVYLIIFDQLN